VVEIPGCQEVDSTTVESTRLNQESTGYKVSYVDRMAGAHTAEALAMTLRTAPTSRAATRGVGARQLPSG
jgi:hypothetical protein